MKREGLLSAIIAAAPQAGDLLFVERRGSDYDCQVILPGDPIPDRSDAAPPDAWIYYGGHWPLDAPARCAAIVKDLLAELESMTGGVDRCRWPIDEPWPHMH
ncbi:MAG: hypothetical protein M3395_06775 [Chloroflexota bacterium]|nr:hypothetical protein [Chloroflexota bacterium]